MRHGLLLNTAALLACVAACGGGTPLPPDVERGSTSALAGVISDDKDGTALAGVAVHAFAADGDGSSAVAHTVSATDGTFSLAELAPGAYRVRIDQRWYNDAATFADATPVLLSAGKSAQLRMALTLVRGSISGLVTDAEGVPLAGATVSAQSVVSQQVIGTDITTSSGEYLLSLPAGTYMVHLRKSGFSDATVPGTGRQALGTITVLPGASVKSMPVALAAASTDSDPTLAALTDLKATLPGGAATTLAGFSPDTLTGYALELGAASSFTITATASSSAARITLRQGDAVLTSGVASAPIPVAAGSTVMVAVTVTSGNGASAKTYVLTARRPNTSAALLRLSYTPLNGTAQAIEDFSYTAKDSFIVVLTPSFTLTPVAAGPATISIDHGGGTTASGSASAPINIAANSTIEVEITVTAESGAQEVYTVSAHRPSDETALASLSYTPAGGSLTAFPGFAPGTLSYTPFALGNVLSFTLTATTVSPGASIVMSAPAGAVASGATSAAFVFAAQTQRTVQITVTAADGISTRQYTVIFTSTSATDASLSNLEYTPSGGGLAQVPSFDPATTDYPVVIGNASEFNVRATANHASATLTVEGSATTSGVDSANLSVNPGATVPATIVITAADGMTTRTYTVSAYRYSNVTLPASVVLEHGSTVVVFDDELANQTSFSGIDLQGPGAFILTVTTQAPSSALAYRIDVNSTALTSGVASAAIPFVAPLTVYVDITAEDGTSRASYQFDISN